MEIEKYKLLQKKIPIGPFVFFLETFPIGPFVIFCKHSLLGLWHFHEIEIFTVIFWYSTSFKYANVFVDFICFCLLYFLGHVIDLVMPLSNFSFLFGNLNLPLLLIGWKGRKKKGSQRIFVLTYTVWWAFEMCHEKWNFFFTTRHTHI